MAKKEITQGRWLASPHYEQITIFGVPYYANEPIPSDVPQGVLADMIKNRSVYLEGGPVPDLIRGARIGSKSSGYSDRVDGEGEGRSKAIQFEDVEPEDNEVEDDDEDFDGDDHLGQQDPDVGEYKVVAPAFRDKAMEMEEKYLAAKAAEAEAPVKRKRGRPRKVVTND